MDPEGLAEQVLSGDRLTLARLLTRIENDDPEGLEALNILYPSTGRAHLVGITGAPGTGKSTLVNRLAKEIREGGIEDSSRKRNEPPTVAIVAVDPSSPFTGGAILGDRIRMRDLTGDPGIFIRSMASRGALGGVAKATAGVVEALDAAGFGVVLIETVGAGQAEVEIARTAHTTVVVDAPGLGDDVQAIKAGILEIADILVVNKSDLPGAENTLNALRSTLTLAHPTRSYGRSTDDDNLLWIPPVLPTVATKGDGIPELLQAIHEHRQHLQDTGEGRLRERERISSRLEQLLRDRLIAQFRADHPDGTYEALLADVLARNISPQQAVDQLIQGEAG